MKNIQKPNKKVIKEYLYKWDHLEEHYIWQESSLDKLFHEDYKYNTDLNEILIKCSCLNDFYSTNIFLIYPVAKKIFNLQIDKRLKDGDPSLVNDIADIEIAGKKKYFYSFETMLWHFQETDKFSNFKRNNLRDYTFFKKVLYDFQKFYDIEEFTLRDIDKYLWIAGKEYFPKNYKK